ncbi:hypothetical protein WA026_012320 [Henosepilachna vigintioctopunctata]|uniref:Uncharacterized protein n=1 Tax=Henosepilachna vigintioctopunctata TaxID=420089 RepID=A0AAW1UPY8_9CUCU
MDAFGFHKTTMKTFLNCCNMNGDQTLKEPEEIHSKQTSSTRSRSQKDKVLIWFYATGSFSITPGEVMCLSEALACDIVNRVTHSISLLSPRFIKFPSTEIDRSINKQEFFPYHLFQRSLDL